MTYRRYYTRFSIIKLYSFTKFFKGFLFLLLEDKKFSFWLQKLFFPFLNLRFYLIRATFYSNRFLVDSDNFDWDDFIDSFEDTDVPIRGLFHSNFFSKFFWASFIEPESCILPWDLIRFINLHPCPELDKQTEFSNKILPSKQSWLWSLLFLY